MPETAIPGLKIGSKKSIKQKIPSALARKNSGVRDSPFAGGSIILS
jgi:hypothetical protein